MLDIFREKANNVIGRSESNFEQTCKRGFSQKKTDGQSYGQNSYYQS